MNLPFYCAVHAQPHHHCRCTHFALERLWRTNALEPVLTATVDGGVEIMAEMVAQALPKLPGVGPALAPLTQLAAAGLGRARLGARVARLSSRHLSCGCFMIAQRPATTRPT